MGVSEKMAPPMSKPTAKYSLSSDEEQAMGLGTHLSRPKPTSALHKKKHECCHAQRASRGKEEREKERGERREGSAHVLLGESRKRRSRFTSPILFISSSPMTVMASRYRPP